jgi:hypothetical protein
MCLDYLNLQLKPDNQNLAHSKFYIVIKISTKIFSTINKI